MGSVLNSANDNKDLVWDLDSFSQRQKAIDFVMSFENKLCVYSSSVGQLYTNYNIFFPKEEDRKLVILPNPYAHHDTFHSIPEEAITATGLHIISGDSIGKEGLYLTIPFKGGTTKHRVVPLQIGLRVLAGKCPPDKPLLPILMKGDLREMDKATPCLHLHRIHLDRLEDHSNLERQSVERAVTELIEKMS